MSNADEPAFPGALIESRDVLDDPVTIASLGLTKREYFAAMALQGLLACPHQMCTDMENQIGLARQYADELLAELAANPGSDEHANEHP